MKTVEIFVGPTEKEDAIRSMLKQNEEVLQGKLLLSISARLIKNTKINVNLHVHRCTQSLEEFKSSPKNPSMAQQACLLSSSLPEPAVFICFARRPDDPNMCFTLLVTPNLGFVFTCLNLFYYSMIIEVA
jgi:hypothetical protein